MPVNVKVQSSVVVQGGLIQARTASNHYWAGGGSSTPSQPCSYFFLFVSTKEQVLTTVPHPSCSGTYGDGVSMGELLVPKVNKVTELLSSGRKKENWSAWL